MIKENMKTKEAGTIAKVNRKETMKNMIVLLCDCLRYDHVTKEITPNIMRIAENGLFYTNASTLGTNTVTSMPYLFSSSKKYIPEQSLSTLLSKSGYKTTLVSTNWFVYNKFFTEWDEAVYYPEFKKSSLLGAKLNKMRNVLGEVLYKRFPLSLKNLVVSCYRFLSPYDLPYMRAQDLLDITLKKMNRGPYFIWTHLMDSHLPYFPIKRQHGQSKIFIQELTDKLLDVIYYGVKLTNEEISFLKQLYAENITEMDEAIGEFHSKLPDDIILIITADHGDEFGEHKQFSHTQDKFVPCLTHVPLIVSGIGKTGICDELITHSQFKELVCDLLEVA